MTRDRPDIVPISVRSALRDAMGGWGPYTVAEVGEMFVAYDFAPTTGDYDQSHGARANEADRCQAAIDFADVVQVERYLQLVQEVLDDNAGDERTYPRERLQKALKRAGIAADETGRLQLPKPAATKTLDPARVPTESDIRLHLGRLERLDQEPEELIGAAKDLVEATAKYVLLTLEVPFDRNADVAALSKQALASLGLHPDAIAPTAKGADPMKRILGASARSPPASPNSATSATASDTVRAAASRVFSSDTPSSRRAQPPPTWRSSWTPSTIRPRRGVQRRNANPMFSSSRRSAPATWRTRDRGPGGPRAEG